MKTYLIVLLILALAEWLYMPVARRLGITAPVTSRSMHKGSPVTGAGIVFVFGAIAFAVINHSIIDIQWIYVLVGGFVLSIVSFADDIRPLPPLPRLILQILVLCLAFKSYCYPQALHIFFLAVVCGICCVNAFNFIDGIGGMLAFYGIVVLGTLLFAVSMYCGEYCELLTSLTALLLVAAIVFTAFNLGDRAFAGDVGAITLGFFVAVIILKLILSSGDITLVTLIIVVLFDTCITALHRLFAGENVLQPHNFNIYQVLAGKWKLTHLSVSLGYASLQLVISAVYLLLPVYAHMIYLLLVISLLMVVYVVIRRSPRSV